MHDKFLSTEYLEEDIESLYEEKKNHLRYYFIELLDYIKTNDWGKPWWYFIKNGKSIRRSGVVTKMWKEYKNRFPETEIGKFLDLMLITDKPTIVGLDYYLELNSFDIDLFLEDAFSVDIYRKIVSNRNYLAKFMTIIFYIKYCSFMEERYIRTIIYKRDYERILAEIEKNMIVNQQPQKIFYIIYGYNVNWKNVAQKLQRI